MNILPWPTVTEVKHDDWGNEPEGVRDAYDKQQGNKK